MLSVKAQSHCIQYVCDEWMIRVKTVCQDVPEPVDIAVITGTRVSELLLSKQQSGKAWASFKSESLPGLIETLEGEQQQAVGASSNKTKQTTLAIKSGSKDQLPRNGRTVKGSTQLQGTCKLA